MPRTLYLVLVIREPESLLEVVDHKGPGIIIEKRPGDACGWCPVFENEDDARAAYPHAVIQPVSEVRR